MASKWINKEKQRWIQDLRDALCSTHRRIILSNHARNESMKNRWYDETDLFQILRYGTFLFWETEDNQPSSIPTNKAVILGKDRHGSYACVPITPVNENRDYLVISVFPPVNEKKFGVSVC